MTAHRMILLFSLSVSAAYAEPVVLRCSFDLYATQGGVKAPSPEFGFELVTDAEGTYIKGSVPATLTFRCGWQQHLTGESSTSKWIQAQ